MDGRTAAINVLGGAALGASVPFVGALVLSQATKDFQLIDHLFTLIFLAIACGAIGVVINLPWGAGGAAPETVVNSDTAGSPEDFVFDAGDSPDSSFADTSTGSQQRARPGAPSKRYAMSRREALRTLDLPHDAADDEVREAYRRLAMEHHPDHAAAAGAEAVDEATRKFVRIREAYEVLIDED